MAETTRIEIKVNASKIDVPLKLLLGVKVVRGFLRLRSRGYPSRQNGTAVVAGLCDHRWFLGQIESAV